MADERIKVTVDERIAVIRLSDPERRNAMSLPMREQCIATLRGLEERGEADAVVFIGEGDKAFSAGADINEVATRTVEGELSTRAQLRRELPRLIESMRLPTIAAIHGHCLGAGLELALACTLRIAADNAKLGLPEINLGVIPGSGGTQRLTRMVGLGRAMELVTLGEPIDAAGGAAHRPGEQGVRAGRAAAARARDLPQVAGQGAGVAHGRARRGAAQPGPGPGRGARLREQALRARHRQRRARRGREGIQGKAQAEVPEMKP